MNNEIERPNVWGNRLKQARLAAGLSQRQLGIEAGIDPGVASTRINRYELGVHQPDFIISQALAKVLNISAAFFYTAEDDLARFIFNLNRITSPAQRANLLSPLNFENTSSHQSKHEPST